MKELLLGIDVGTYSSKGVVVDIATGAIVKSQIVEHGMAIPKPGWAEQDADQVWWADVVKICHRLLERSEIDARDVTGVGISAIGPTLLPLDAAGNPLRPGILYGVDTRASEEIELLNQRFGEENIFTFSKMAFSSQAIGPKILWLQRNEPDIWHKIDHLTTASSYLVYRLTGEKVIDRHTASHYMPLMDMDALEWSWKFADGLVDPRKLPKLGWSNEMAGVIHAQAAAETGLIAGTPVAVGAVDALSEAISVGAIEPGDLMIMYGSTTFFILVLTQPAPDERTWTTAGAFSGQYNLAAGMATTGSLTRWFRDEFAKDFPQGEGFTNLFIAADEVAPGSQGLLVLPYFSGERTPINDPQARGVIAGLTLSHQRPHLFRAILEGVAYGIRHNLETFRQIGAPVNRIIAVGGGTKTPIWPQIVSNVCGVTQTIPKLTIGASYGDAFLAGLSSGRLTLSDLNHWVKSGYSIVPDPALQQRYDTMYQHYLNLYSQTRNIMHML